MNKLEQTLLNCLMFAGEKSLPEEWTKENVWVRAVVLVHKMNGVDSYAVAQFNGKKESIIYDPGGSSRIREIKAIYPYMYLDKCYLPSNMKTREDIIAFLMEYYNWWDQKTRLEKMKKEDLWALLLSTGINNMIYDYEVNKKQEAQ